MHKFIKDLAPLQHVHATFAEWERARHRADFFARCAFPDSHPVKQILADMGHDLLEHRYVADEVVRDVAWHHGDFRTWVNGFFFEDPKDWFQPQMPGPVVSRSWAGRACVPWRWANFMVRWTIRMLPQAAPLAYRQPPGETVHRTDY